MAEDQFQKFYDKFLSQKRPKWMNIIIEQEMLDTLHDEDVVKLIISNWNSIEIAYMLLQMTARDYKKDIKESEVPSMPSRVTDLASDEQQLIETMYTVLVPFSKSFQVTFEEMSYLWIGELFNLGVKDLVNRKAVLERRSKLYDKYVPVATEDQAADSCHGGLGMLQHEVRKLSAKYERLIFWDETPDVLRTALALTLNLKSLSVSAH